MLRAAFTSRGTGCVSPEQSVLPGRCHEDFRLVLVARLGEVNNIDLVEAGLCDAFGAGGDGGDCGLADQPARALDPARGAEAGASDPVRGRGHLLGPGDTQVRARGAAGEPGEQGGLRPGDQWGGAAVGRVAEVVCQVAVQRLDAQCGHIVAAGEFGGDVVDDSAGGGGGMSAKP